MDKRIYIKLISRKQAIGTDFLRFSKFLASNRADVFHIFEPFLPTFPTLYFFIKSLRSPIVYDSGDIHFAVSRLSGDFWSPYYLSLKFSESLAFRLSDRVIVRGRGMKEVLEYLYQIDPEKTMWIPDGVDLSRFFPIPSYEARKALGLENKFTIGYASNYRPIVLGRTKLGRGWELLYVAKRLVNIGYKDFVIIMMGKGKMLNLLKKITVDLGISDFVKFTDFIPDNLYPLYINACDIGFYESVEDISYHAMIGTKMLEFMACGKPMVAGNIGETRYSLPHAGILVEPLRIGRQEDTNRYLNDLTNAIITLMEDETLRKKLGSNARKVIEKYYNWNTIAKKLHSLYVTL
jgi:glycosyltransferase involved in cell wall biosynthesis